MLFVSETIPTDCLNELLRRGFNVRLLKPFSSLPPPVASHADLLLFPLGDSLLMPQEYHRENRRLFGGCSVLTTDEAIGNTYPNDVLLNALRVGEVVFGAGAHLSEKIRERYAVVSVRQGYARCSVCQLNDDAFITADPSLSKALREAGKEVLTIQSGHIELPGYDIGFLGGASFVHLQTVYFFGTLACHPDGAAIRAFIERHGFSVYMLSDRPLFDVGGVVMHPRSEASKRRL